MIDSEIDRYHKIKWLMFCRVLFNTLLLGSTVVVHLGEGAFLVKPLIVLYGLITSIYFLSVGYVFLLRYIRDGILFAYIQIGIDTVFVSLLIFLTGSYSSLFSFLYLLVIIYASMLLYRKGSMIMAALCSIQYGIMVDLEYYGILKPFGEDDINIAELAWSQVFYKVLIIMVACFTVAFLSSLLAEQAKETRKELQAMEAHVKRVQRMAAIGEMAAGLAHEIKNPLASLRGCIQLLNEEMQQDPAQERLMKIVLREADRLSSLVGDFLLFAKPPAGKAEIIDLEQAVSEIADMFQEDAKCQGRISIETRLTPDVFVQIDPSHLNQILWNFLLNAAESIKDTGRIEIAVYPFKSKHAVIKVVDNGCGMSQETLKSIFDPFFTTKPSGTGLGLSIVHRLVEAYDGCIDVESEVGKGTSFSLKLKRVNGINERNRKSK